MDVPNLLVLLSASRDNAQGENPRAEIALGVRIAYLARDHRTAKFVSFEVNR